MKKRLSRSVGGDITLIICLMLLAVVMLLPIVYAVVTSLKPNNELWIFPPRFFVRNPTTKNYSGLFELMNTSWVPFSRYFFNTLFITVVGSIGHIMIATMCAYPLACYRFPGSRFIFKLIQTSLMFSASVTAIPTFIVMSRLRLVDNHLALILPAFALPLGLFLMKQFIEQMVHPALLESAELDGASEFVKCFKIVFPMVKPAWLTLAIFSVQTLWTVGNTPYIYTENKKTLNYAMSQIVSAGIARQGVGAAVSVVMLLVPLLFFIISQSNIVETMGSSGIKD